MITWAWCHNGYHMLPADEVARRARLARLDGLIVKYGDPAFERALTREDIVWGTERFALASQAAREGATLADAVAAGARFAVANCEPNDGGGWDGPHASTAIRALIDTFRRRHPRVPLYICADLRPGRSLDAPFVGEAARGGIDGWMPMVYPKAFGQSVERAFDAAFPGATYLGLPCFPVLQAYDAVGAASIADQVAATRTRGATACSLYVIETASDAELTAFAAATKPVAPPAQDTLAEAALTYVRGAIAILDHGAPEELRAWADFFARRRAVAAKL